MIQAGMLPPSWIPQPPFKSKIAPTHSPESGLTCPRLKSLGSMGQALPPKDRVIVTLVPQAVMQNEMSKRDLAD